MIARPRIAAVSLLVFSASALRLAAVEAGDFPAQTRWILSLDLRAARASPLPALATNLLDSARRQEATRKLAAIEALFGVNPLQDIDRIAIAGNGGAGKGGVVYIHGRFDAQRLTTILGAAKDFAASDYNGVPVLRWRDDKDGKCKHLAFATPELAIFSDNMAPLIDALDVLAGRLAGLAEDSPLAVALKSSAGDILSLHAIDLASVVGAQPQAETLRQAAALSLRAGAADASTIRSRLAVVAENEEKAVQIQDVLAGIRAIALLRAAEAPGPALVASRTEITREGGTVNVVLTLSAAQLESVLRALSEWKAARSAPPPAPAAGGAQ
jgi:hypothetical protein